MLYRSTPSTFTFDQQFSLNENICHTENLNPNMIPKSDKARTVLQALSCGSPSQESRSQKETTDFTQDFSLSLNYWLYAGFFLHIKEISSYIITK